MVDPQNAAALVAALADLVQAGEVDLTDLETPDLRSVAEALSAALAVRLEGALPGLG